MYKSPIEIIHEQVNNALETKIENGICKVLHNMDINVDKNELIKALKYDRDQYNAGYADGLEQGRQEMAKEFAKRLKEKMAYSFIFGKSFLVEKDIDETLAEVFKEQGND